MADRVKYFVLGLLLLVVGGVIAFDRWNGDAAPPNDKLADGGDASEGGGWEVDIGRRERDAAPPAARPDPGPAKGSDSANPNSELRIVPPPQPEPKRQPLPEPEPKPLPKPPKPEPQPAPKAKTHVVRSGESLEIISMRYYKTRKGVDWIADANNIRNKNNIYENQKLIIPARKEGRSGAVNNPTPKPRPRPKTIPSTIRVRAGETDLYKICRRIYGPKGLGARVHRVMELNGLYSADVKPGALLKLPPK